MKNHYELVFCQLLSELKRIGMSRNRVTEYQQLTERFLKDYNSGLISSYDDFVDKLSKTTNNPICLWRKIAVVKAIRDYDLYGKSPRVLHKSKYSLLPSNYRILVDEIVSYACKQGRADRSLQNLRDDGSSFFYHVYSLGITRIEDITLHHVESYFYCNGEIKRGYCVRKGLMWFLKHCQEYTDDNIFHKLSSMLPKIVNTRKVYPSLTDMEAEKVESAILDNTNRLTWRDRAIGALSFYTGMRACDIARLQYNNILWKENKLHFIQSKTGREVTLRLDGVVGNPIYKYIVNERPKNKSPFIFIRKRGHTPIDSHDIYKAILSVFYLAGIRIMDGRRGAHLLRHRLATTMVQNDTDISIVSSALGHVNPNSVNSYLEADTKHLKLCALSIDNIMSLPLSPIRNNYIIKTFLDFLSLEPEKVFPSIDKTRLKMLGLTVSEAPLSLVKHNYYFELKQLSIDNSLIKKIKLWKN